MMSVKACIISIGNELLIGRTINSNAAFIGRQLFGMGIHPHKVITIPDTEIQISKALEEALKEADVVITTGGLGPTNDDITKVVITRFFNGKLLLNESLLEKIKEKFSRRGIPMADVNREQAMVPDNAEILENGVGIAPGLYFRKKEKHVFVLPGVPAEMKYLMEYEVIPILKKVYHEEQPQKLIYRTIGIPESALYERLEPLISDLPGVDFMFYPSYSGVDVKIFCRDSCEMQKIHEKVFPVLEKYCYTRNEDESIEEVIQKICLKNQYTLSVAESCTGGLLQHLITNVSGSSGYFAGGVVSYSNEAKIQLLQVNKNDLEQFGAVSEPVARQMAEGVKKVFQTTIGIGITGIAGPTGGTPEKPVGLVYIGVSFKNHTQVRRFQFGNDRRVNKTRSAYSALHIVWKLIKEELK
jgi:nicotinamide-nucleotide amidase